MPERKLEYWRDNIASHSNTGETTLPATQILARKRNYWGYNIANHSNSGEKMLVGNLIHQILLPWVNKYGEKKVRQNLFCQRENLIQFLTTWNWKYNRTSKQAQCNVSLSILDWDMKFSLILNSNDIEQTSEMNKTLVYVMSLNQANVGQNSQIILKRVSRSQ